MRFCGKHNKRACGRICGSTGRDGRDCAASASPAQLIPPCHYFQMGCCTKGAACKPGSRGIVSLITSAWAQKCNTSSEGLLGSGQWLRFSHSHAASRSRQVCSCQWAGDIHSSPASGEPPNVGKTRHRKTLCAWKPCDYRPGSLGQV